MKDTSKVPDTKAGKQSAEMPVSKRFAPPISISDAHAFTQSLADLAERELEAAQIKNEDDPAYTSAQAAQKTAWEAVIALANAYATHRGSYMVYTASLGTHEVLGCSRDQDYIKTAICDLCQAELDGYRAGETVSLPDDLEMEAKFEAILSALYAAIDAYAAQKVREAIRFPQPSNLKEVFRFIRQALHPAMQKEDARAYVAEYLPDLVGDVDFLGWLTAGNDEEMAGAWACPVCHFPHLINELVCPVCTHLEAARAHYSSLQISGDPFYFAPKILSEERQNWAQALHARWMLGYHRATDLICATAQVSFDKAFPNLDQAHALQHFITEYQAEKAEEGHDVSE